MTCSVNWLVVTSVFPDVERRGCAFHFVQSIVRLQEVELQSAWNKDEGTHTYLQKLCFNGLSIVS